MDYKKIGIDLISITVYGMVIMIFLILPILLFSIFLTGLIFYLIGDVREHQKNSREEYWANMERIITKHKCKRK